jgi:hypothetical protein
VEKIYKNLKDPGFVPLHVRAAFKIEEKLNLKQPGTDVMILKIFLPKNLVKKLPFLTQNKAKF